jgi:predicted PilT family ATPase
LERYLPIEEVTLETNDKGVIVNIPSNRMNYIAKRCRRKIQKLEEKTGVRITLKAI